VIRRRSKALLLAMAITIAVSAVLAGCGSGGNKKTIPHDDGARLIRLLRKARDAAGNRDRCNELQSAVSAAQAQVSALPSSVDGDTRRSLTNGVSNLSDRARQDCQQATTTNTTPTTPPTTTETVPPTTTETVPPTTTETAPPTQTQPTQTQPPPQTVPGKGNGGVPPGKGKGPQGAPGQPKKGKGKPGKGKKEK
jgi:hypothetical protein